MIVRKCGPPGIFSLILDSISGFHRPESSFAASKLRLRASSRVYDIYVCLRIKIMSSQEHPQSSWYELVVKGDDGAIFPVFFQEPSLSFWCKIPGARTLNWS